MKLELEFQEVPEDLECVTGDIYVEDHREADAPSQQLQSMKIGPFTIQSSQPTVTLDVDFTVFSANQEPALIIRAKAYTQAKQPIEFLNTTENYLPNNPDSYMTVTMSRIR
ncbi:MAG: hypothetical protein NPIRA04_11090 [Nitrospirales bacterium]|nr:MAG: hypothetical protein NPIRA04_11090 [Nitrospirales bacterium]